MDKVDVTELKDRIRRSMRGHANDDLLACCWQGYIAALLEWGLITPNEHLSLMDECQVGPDVDPMMAIFLGQD